MARYYLLRCVTPTFGTTPKIIQNIELIRHAYAWNMHSRTCLHRYK